MRHAAGIERLVWALAFSSTVGCSSSSGAGGGASDAAILTNDAGGGTDAAGQGSNEDGAVDAAAPSDAATGGPDAPASGDGPVGPHPFACDALTCDSGTQICSVVSGHLPGEPASYQCVSVEGGTPSCGGSTTTTTPGQCGCYESADGEVTNIECPP
jgi:hypothetical protein